jgi:hypothetical protein
VAEEVRAGLGDNPSPEAQEKVEDILVGASRVLGNAETADKRHMIANIILNAATTAEAEVARGEAALALSTLDDMTATDAMLFGIIAADAASYLAGSRGAFIPQGPDFRGVSGWVFDSTVKSLIEQQLLQWGEQEGDQEYVRLTEQGDWLRRWVLRHPRS